MKIKLLIKFFILAFLFQGVSFAADDEHDHDHSAHSDEPFMGILVYVFMLIILVTQARAMKKLMKFTLILT